jgi:hypothetical protein
MSKTRLRRRAQLMRPGRAWNTMRQDAALEERVERVLDEPGQFTAGAGLAVDDEAGRVLLHQPIQSGLFRTVSLVVERGAIGRPLPCTGLPAVGVHDEAPTGVTHTVSSRALRLNRLDCCPPTCALRRGTSCW